MNLKINKYNLIYIIGSILLCVYMFGMVTGKHAHDVTYILNSTAFIGFVQIVFCLIIWKKRTGNFLSLFTFYLMAFYVFTMGQSFLHMLNLPFDFADVYDMVSFSALIKSHVFTILCITFLFEGAMLAVSNRDKHKHHNLIKEDSMFMGQTGIFLFLVSVVPMAIYLYSLIKAFMVGGYAYAFESVADSGGFMRLMNKIHPFFIPSLVMIIIEYHDYRRRFGQFLMAVVGLIYFFIGERTGAASILLALLILDSQLKERRGEKNIHSNKLKIIAVVVIFALFIPAIGVLRNTDNMSMASLINNVKANGVVSVLSDTLATMGFSEFPLGKTIEIVPVGKDYAYGESYFYALLAIFPNIFGGVHVAVEHSALAQWLMDYLHMTYGPGFSYPAEAWYNFGWYGCLVMIIIGYVFTKFMYIPKGTKINNFTLFISIAFFLQTITSPRRELMTVIRLVGYYVFIPVIIAYVTDKVFKANRNMRI